MIEVTTACTSTVWRWCSVVISNALAPVPVETPAHSPIDLALLLVTLKLVTVVVVAAVTTRL